MITTFTKRPRNVNAWQAAAMLYGDWGTSKAYVIGLAFALAGYQSFWYIAAVSILMAIVGINYIYICKYNPTGGGVYVSARKKSEILSLVGAFFLIADYLITASLSALSSFKYLGFAMAEYWAIGAILVIGAINFFGPKHSGNLAILLAIPTVFIVILLGLVSIPYIPSAIQNLQFPQGSFLDDWTNFVGIIVALSGIEAIANTTGVMQLDPGSTDQNPSVHQTSKKAIIWVMLEVCFFTALFGLVVAAIPGIVNIDGEVLASDHSEIRDDMLKYMGEFFVSQGWGLKYGYLFGSAIGLLFAVLLLSAVNTAIVALVSLFFVMSRDGEFPQSFQELTPFGVPKYPLILASLAPIVILFFVHDVAALAELYAVGFVGAIATNLGANATDNTITMSKKSRVFMLATCVFMAAIEITLFITKPNARRFAISILTCGLILRSFVLERRQKQWVTKKVKLKHASLYTDDARVPLHQGAILCAVSTIGKTLNFALQEAKRHEQPLYILFVREQKVITDEDRLRLWIDDELACDIFDYAKESSHEMNIKFFYAISDSPSDTIVDMAKQLHVSRLIIGRPRQSAMLQMLRGNVVLEISEILPTEIDLLVIS